MEYIYALADPRDKQPRYVGRTNNLTRRHTQHCYTNELTPKGEWVQTLRAQGVSPTMHVLECVGPKENSLFREKFWISFGLYLGWDLLNVANPSVEEPEFGKFFASQLRHEYDVFAMAIESRSPLVLITRGQISVFLAVVKVILAFLVGLFAGYGAWLIEYSVTQDIVMATWQGVAGGISCGLLLALILFGAIKRWWWAAIYLGFYIFACIYTTFWW